MKPLPLRRTRASRQGFALVVTISLMVLLSLLAVGMLSLSAVSLRSSQAGDAAAIARANARMALTMAIGQLQREMGPDSRISAPHGVGGDSPGGEPHWTAVYDAWELPGNDGADAEDPASREVNLRAWLASGTNAGGTADRIPLVSRGSLGPSAPVEDQVRVPTHAVAADRGSGRIAWWTSDEGTKAKINAGRDDTSFGNSDPLFQVQAPQHPDHQTFTALENFEWLPGQRSLALSRNQVELAAGLDQAALGESLHDLTVWSAGLLTDVRAGRLKRDLTQLLTRPIEDVEDMPLYITDGRMNRWNFDANGSVSNAGNIPASSRPNTSDEWGINLEELHLFHNLYRELEWNGSTPTLRMAETREQVVDDRYYLYKRPVIEAVQFILSLKAESTGGGTYRMVAMLDGMVALSNPNDVPIVWPAGLIFPVQLQNVPYDLRWNIRKTDGTRNTNTASSADFGLFVGRISGGTRGRSAGFTLEPGEAVVFGSTTGSGPQLDLRRGFVPSGGVRINPSSNNGWDLRATGLRSGDRIDFTLTKGDTGYRGLYTYYNAWIGDRRTGANAKGWQIDACTLSAQGDINSDQMNELMISPIRPPQVRPVSDFINRPQPFMMISFVRNVERDSGGIPRDAFASRPFQLAEAARGWSGYSPNTVAASLHAHQRMITAQPLNYQFETMAAGNGGEHVYHGGGRQPNLGGSFNVIRRRLPLAPPLSLGAFENAIAAGFTERFRDAPAIGPDPYPSDAQALSGDRAATPSIAKAIGNSWASPFLEPDQVFRPSSGSAPDRRATTDPSWMANTALWDTWFLSGMVNDSGAGNSPYLTDRRTPREQFQELSDGTGALRNTRYLFHAHQPAEAALEELFEGGDFKPEALGKLANYLLVDGAFNVNSTSVDAWTALLSSVRDQELIKADGSTEGFDHPFGTLGYVTNTATAGTAGDWTGLRDLSASDIENLAEAIVEQVKTRGPFLSMADFVNRRPDGESGQQALGALQAAIDQTGLNQSHSVAGRTVASPDLDPLPGSDVVSSELVPARAIGTPGYLSQAGVLTAIGSQITVRSDTFRIRAYGDARDASGKVLSRAWCEAVIQRLPEFVDATDPPEADRDSLSPVNTRFGRRFTVRSFRWLTAEEV
ncbi:hypothetical protein [Haloferula sp. A504]|uniref:hypothetical protein n=1 Tax=Haloferula sp. A504 TaxID=3373601 RepID=UPI0031C6A7C2|nr:hypothetical protein [Verrucomicrobiaceae bacterium E54]